VTSRSVWAGLSPALADLGPTRGTLVQSRLQHRVDVEIERITRRPLRGALTAAATVTTVVTIVAGLLMRLTDPHAFPNVGLGLWWAIQTTTTVGYGDVVPHSVAGRIVAAFVMIVGIGFITVSTAAITSAFLEAARERRAVESPNPLVAEVRALRDQMEALTAEVRAGRASGGPDRSS
jgi:voltage-gated potassium channel